MRILITGASGFIGRRLVSRLSGGHEIVPVVRDPGRAPQCKSGTAVVMDLAQPLDPSRLPPRIDTIVHLAQGNVAFPDGAEELFAVNTGAVQHLLHYGRRSGARHFILASTGDVYGQRLGLSREADPVRPVTHYAVTKYAAELLAQAYSAYLRPCVLRLFQPYGPGQAERLVPRLADRIRRRTAVSLHESERPRMTPIYVDDVTRVIEQVIDSSHGGILNVAGDRLVSVRELAEEIGRVLDVQPTFEQTGKESADLAGDNTLMKQLLGTWRMVPLTDGLSRTLEGDGATTWQSHA